MSALFRFAILLNAFLLFLVQPMFAKMALPLLGGSPAVWTTCMWFFQTALLLGYLYAHVSVRLLGVRRQAILHGVLVLVPLLVLPVAIPADTRPPSVSVPAGWLLAIMTVSVGLPFLMLSTTAPLLQRWFALVGRGAGADPYWLYAASNAGSLGGLLLYPLLIEPLMSLRSQRLWWAAGYGLSAALIVTCAALAFAAAASSTSIRREADDRAPSGLRRLRWTFLSAAPSGLMLAVTFHISTDVAAVPLLWIVPLALYLSTFIIAFSAAATRVVPIARRALPLVLLPLVMLMVGRLGVPLWFAIPLHLAAFWLLALLCHAELARTRPSPSHLTEFYVWLAIGGMLGGFFNTFVAPWVFNGVGEYPLLLAAATFGIANPATFRDLATSRRLVIVPVLTGAIAAVIVLAASMRYIGPSTFMPFLAISALLCFTVSRHAAAFALGISLFLVAGKAAPDRSWGAVLHAERTFFGVYRVTATTARKLVSLYHGTTLHGSQVAGINPPEPLTYYTRSGPIGDVFAALPRDRVRSVGLVGLGVGSLAAYAYPEQQWTFYEIDPTVERIAWDGRFFNFLRSCGDPCRVVIGDGRLSIDRSDERHDVIVLDAFSSDAIPVHLLTREALTDYLEHLEQDGVLAFHISNRHFALAPVLGRLSADRGLVARFREDDAGGRPSAEHMASHWVVMARTPEALAPVAAKPGWNPLTSDGGHVWTDDFSNVWGALKWK